MYDNNSDNDSNNINRLFRHVAYRHITTTLSKSRLVNYILYYIIFNVHSAQTTGTCGLIDVPIFFLLVLL